jgi:hypothetical protein
MRSPDKKQGKPRWLHFLAIAAGVLACLCAERVGPGWSGSIAAAAAALLFPEIIYYRKTGKQNFLGNCDTARHNPGSLSHRREAPG